MNKNFKRFAAILCGATASLGVLAISACGGSTVTYDGYGSEYIVAHDSGKTVTYTFEAEYTNLGNKKGPAASGSYAEKTMINKAAEASNGYCVNGTCAKGVSVNFVIVSDREVENAILTLTLGMECNFAFTLNPDEYLVRVDPVSEEDVQPYSDNGAWGSWDQFFLGYYYDSKTPIAQNAYGTQPFGGYYIEEFECGDLAIEATSSDPSNFMDYRITTKLHLYAGLNCISLITNNDKEPQGADNATMTASAPIVDCIKITTDAQLGMYSPMEYYSNLDTSKACTFK